MEQDDGETGESASEVESETAGESETDETRSGKAEGADEESDEGGPPRDPETGQFVSKEG